MQNVEEIARPKPFQKDTAARVLARAFYNDPMFQHVIPNGEKRYKELLWLMRKVVNYSFLYGEIHGTPAVEGVACWLPPGHTDLTIFRLIRTGFFCMVPRFGLTAYRRFNDNVSYTNRIHKRHAPNPHWYLWAIGVDPLHHGKGIGGKLMQPILASACGTGTPCYLGTHNEKNLRFYEKHGFRVVHEGIIPKQGLRVWAMLREP